MSSLIQSEDKNQSLWVRLKSITYEAKDVLLFEFRPLHGQKLQAFSAGSHIDIHLPNGLIRQYSLCNSPLENERYVVGVKKDPRSRGGSTFMHNQLKVGSELKISLPRNNFPLWHEAPHSVLIGGGIGITPLISMAHELQDKNSAWQLFGSFKTRSEVALVDQLDPSKVHLHIDDESSVHFLDIASILANAPMESHFYCCGPEPMLNHFLELSQSIPPSRVHVEYFKPVSTKLMGESFEVKLLQTQKSFSVGPDQTILQVLQKHGISAPGSCEQGICGTCETHVVDGIPDHRDSLLSAEERATNKVMMICCSRSLSPTITLDL
jgi:vanillate O-demethylase ferredoxin subunit